MAFGFLLLIPAGCMFRARTNSMSLMMLEIEVQHAQSTRDRLNRKLWRLGEEIKALKDRIEETGSQLANVDADYQQKIAVLATKQQQRHAMEEDLAANRQQVAVLKKALAEVTALEKKAAQKTKLLAELKARNAALSKQLLATQATVEAKEDSAKKLLQTLQDRIAALDKLVLQLQSAFDAAKALGLEPQKTPPPKQEPVKQEPPKKD